MGKYPKRIFLPALALMMLSGAANAENISVSTPKTSLVVMPPRVEHSNLSIMATS